MNLDTILLNYAYEVDKMCRELIYSKDGEKFTKKMNKELNNTKQQIQKLIKTEEVK